MINNSHELDAPLISDDYSSMLGEGIDDNCDVPSVNIRRFYIVAVIGTSTSIVSFLANSLIAFALLRRRRHRQSHLLYLSLLALSDAFLSFCYGPVIAMDIIKNRVQRVWLNRLWWYYVGPLLALCHTAMSYSSYLIMLASVERYLITEKSRWLTIAKRNRLRLSIGALVIALCIKGTGYFEVTVARNGNCTGLNEFTPKLTEIVHNWYYGTLFKFYFRNIATVFVPFFLLASLNFCIVRTLQRQQRSAAMFRFAASDHKDKVRSASRLLVFIVSIYLSSNILNVIITAWEHISIDSIGDYYEFYEFCTDIISVLTMVACLSRLPVYCACNSEIRTAIISALKPLTFCCRHGPQHIYQKTQTYATSRRKSLRHDRSQHREQQQAMGTDFDKVAVAIALQMLSRMEPQHHQSIITPSHSSQPVFI